MVKKSSHGSLYHNLDDETQDFIHRVGEKRTYNKSDVIFLEGEESHHFYLIVEGCVKISRVSRDGKEVLIALLSPWNFFGEMALLDGLPRSAEASAEEKSMILILHVLHEKHFYNLLEGNPKIAIEFLNELAHRIRNSDSQIKGLSILNARSRVASALLRWALDQGTKMLDTVEISTIPKQQEMANYVGLTRETLNRTLGELEQEGFIQKPDIRTIAVTNFSYFKKIFGPFY